MTSPFFAPDTPTPEAFNVFPAQVAEAHVRVFEIGVAGIDDDIAPLEVRESLITESTGASHGHQHYNRAGFSTTRW